MIPGQRIELDLDLDPDGVSDNTNVAPKPPAFVGDVLERHPHAVTTAPNPPSLSKSARNGFPEHTRRRRPDIASSFKQQQRRRTTGNLEHQERTIGNLEQQLSSSGAKSWIDVEKERADVENAQRMASMSAAEIEQERAELLSSLSPAFVQRLLARSNLDSGSNETDLDQAAQKAEGSVPEPTADAENKPRQISRTSRTVNFEESVSDLDERRYERHSVQVDDGDGDGVKSSDNLQSTTQDNDQNNNTDTTHDSVHFPQPHQPPSLDPHSSSFLDDLHDKYFPQLPSDPDKLEWMKDTTTTTSRNNQSYDPSASALNPDQIRFSFTGNLIPPKLASQIPVTAGLHHHGDAPDAAGYTIAELTLLSRSSYAAQRCIAFQTLGRLLYRLGRGEFGDPGEPGAGTVGVEESFGELARGLWNEVERESVIEILTNESIGKGVDGGKHVSANAYATEAVWLWRKGGGRRWKAE